MGVGSNMGLCSYQWSVRGGSESPVSVNQVVIKRILNWKE